jgi:DNA-binding CsgD family transcriptional regulator
VYQQWVRPQGLRDYCFTQVAKRDGIQGSVGAATYSSRGLVNEGERDTFRLLAPHFRRSLLISGLLDEGKLQLQLYRQLLDRIGAGILIVGKSARLVYANETADQMLSKGTNLTIRHSRVCAASTQHDKGLQEALSRACVNDSKLGNFGNGIPLPGTGGTMAVCYVLPLGRSERRRELGPGLAAIFVTTHGASMPPALEVLSALSGLTSREARIALMIADGAPLSGAAKALGITMNTIRKHLANIFAKTGVKSQLGLVQLVSGLSLPLAAVGSSAWLAI